ncbi:MAG: dTDP-4-dehydrorhamnose 3,5-epimerase, dTDP-4-dehydrorhamnose 3,5-epimerase [Candidatus Peregrinibacteria bacterium GW2011_GWF2_33_10]|nr:MAG: dTDP-4-dehydrorhamnose 3,5-epimerase, dTDP-4-dehydrorhamnose 3,5-epimerase [Candidatus Peregrinibacteria bacterium GW2011_GWF2_33_10]OGJ44955.1 MAG: hypothetical protein A2272_02830 [Candidatus Peregrinibacteria bacterium RIFOXYA12_FULL_33_12]OGJ45253.1 MAG: hypothetical protein A2263_06805 [Candidatus Peregrinibacteria bacterium RIFOXYA2_FULL_33_21]OGJ51177.1 MAG: hypothetical protein A2307_04890 [Candidatus Peregrinibacteria bacterium RIFOXYB2_FULL_33_20]
MDGVKIIPLKKYTDDRGFVIETYRCDEVDHKGAMTYNSFSHFRVIRGPHEHIYQSDYFQFSGPGDFEMYLWDNRKNSKTFGEHIKMTVGESNPTSILVPPGVVHGYKCISKNGAWYFNSPDKLYKGILKKDEVDEIRHEHDKNSKFKIK